MKSLKAWNKPNEEMPEKDTAVFATIVYDWDGKIDCCVMPAYYDGERWKRKSDNEIVEGMVVSWKY